jgi:hypothetical protein
MVRGLLMSWTITSQTLLRLTERYCVVYQMLANPGQRSASASRVG